MNQRIYFDHSATTPVDEKVVMAMNEFMLAKFGNPSSIHSFGREAKVALDEARESVAALLGCQPEEVYFTSGGTEADNLALLGFTAQNRDRGDHVLVSDIEHPAVRLAANELEERGLKVGRIPADRLGEIHLEQVMEMVTDNTLLVSVMHVNNEVGTINDVSAIGQFCRSRGITFHTDAVQSFGKIPVDVVGMNIDMASVSSHKIYGPKGIGALYVRSGIEVNPRGFGGHQESGVRPGTENLPGIIGLGQAAEICREEMDKEANKLRNLRDELHLHLTNNLDDVTLNGHSERRLPGNLNLTFHGVEGEALLMTLDMEGIAVSSGSACSSGSTAPSHILTSIGLSAEEAHSSMRMTLGRSNTERDIDYAGKVIVDAVNRLRTMAVMDTPAVGD